MSKYKRVLLKLSGEALAGDKGTGFDEATCVPVAKQIKDLVDAGTEVAIVIGGGNFWRGRSSETIDRTKADQIGMMATVMNCIYMSEICRSVGLMTQVLTPFSCGSFTKLFSDPAVNPDAKKYDSMQMADIVDNKLGVVDLAAAVLCLENKMPMLIFGLNEENSIANAVAGKSNGTIITVD